MQTLAYIDLKPYFTILCILSRAYLVPLSHMTLTLRQGPVCSNVVRAGWACPCGATCFLEAELTSGSDQAAGSCEALFGVTGGGAWWGVGVWRVRLGSGGLAKARCKNITRHTLVYCSTRARLADTCHVSGAHVSAFQHVRMYAIVDARRLPCSCCGGMWGAGSRAPSASSASHRRLAARCVMHVAPHSRAANASPARCPLREGRIAIAIAARRRRSERWPTAARHCRGLRRRCLPSSRRSAAAGRCRSLPGAHTANGRRHHP